VPLGAAPGFEVVPTAEDGAAGAAPAPAAFEVPREPALLVPAALGAWVVPSVTGPLEQPETLPRSKLPHVICQILVIASAIVLRFAAHCNDNALTDHAYVKRSTRVNRTRQSPSALRSCGLANNLQRH
jgi:hypothetical protein